MLPIWIPAATDSVLAAKGGKPERIAARLTEEKRNLANHPVVAFIDTDSPQN